MRPLLLIAASASLLASAATASTNIVPANWLAVEWPGFAGVLRDGSPWGPGSTGANAIAPVSGTAPAEGTQWNNTSFWWDQDPSVNSRPITWTLTLNRNFTINRLAVQADNDDTYLVEYWDGSDFSPIFSLDAVDGAGLRTRDSGIFAPIITDRFRFSATGGDNYYSLGQFSAFAVPEPSTWAMLIVGFGAVGIRARRRRTAAA